MRIGFEEVLMLTCVNSYCICSKAYLFYHNRRFLAKGVALWMADW